MGSCVSKHVQGDEWPIAETGYSQQQLFTPLAEGSAILTVCTKAQSAGYAVIVSADHELGLVASGLANSKPTKACFQLLGLSEGFKKSFCCDEARYMQCLYTAFSSPGAIVLGKDSIADALVALHNEITQPGPAMPAPVIVQSSDAWPSFCSPSRSTHARLQLVLSLIPYDSGTMCLQISHSQHSPAVHAIHNRLLKSSDPELIKDGIVVDMQPGADSSCCLHLASNLRLSTQQDTTQSFSNADSFCRKHTQVERSRDRIGIIMDETPAMITLLSIKDACVLFQNTLSNKYYGQQTGLAFSATLLSEQCLGLAPSSCAMHPSICLFLQLLFVKHQHGLDKQAEHAGDKHAEGTELPLHEEVIKCVMQDRKPWRETLKVPRSLEKVLHNLLANTQQATSNTNLVTTGVLATPTGVQRISSYHTLPSMRENSSRSMLNLGPGNQRILQSGYPSSDILHTASTGCMWESAMPLDGVQPPVQPQQAKSSDLHVEEKHSALTKAWKALARPFKLSKNSAGLCPKDSAKSYCVDMHTPSESCPSNSTAADRPCRGSLDTCQAGDACMVTHGNPRRAVDNDSANLVTSRTESMHTMDTLWVDGSHRRSSHRLLGRSGRQTDRLSSLMSSKQELVSVVSEGLPGQHTARTTSHMYTGSFGLPDNDRFSRTTPRRTAPQRSLLCNASTPWHGSAAAFNTGSARDPVGAFNGSPSTTELLNMATNRLIKSEHKRIASMPQLLSANNNNFTGNLVRVGTESKGLSSLAQTHYPSSSNFAIETAPGDIVPREDSASTSIQMRSRPLVFQRPHLQNAPSSVVDSIHSAQGLVNVQSEPMSSKPLTFFRVSMTSPREFSGSEAFSSDVLPQQSSKSATVAAQPSTAAGAGRSSSARLAKVQDAKVGNPSADAAKQVLLESIDNAKQELLQDESQYAWHQVFVKQVLDPSTGEPALLIVQYDTTQQTEHEMYVHEFTESQLGMLSEIYPRYVIEDFARERPADLDELALTARHHPHATLLFADIVGFTAMSNSLSEAMVIEFINDLCIAFDDVVFKYGIKRIDTMGDAFFLGSGLLRPDAKGFNVVDTVEDPAACAQRMFACAQEMIYIASQKKMPHNQEPVEIRVGIHTGPCVSGLIGLKMSKWTVLGDTVNVAARMEQTGVPGKIQMTAATRHLLGSEVDFIPTGGVECKGKGVLDTFLWSMPPGWQPKAVSNEIVASEAAAMPAQQGALPASHVEGHIPANCNEQHADIMRMSQPEGGYSQPLILVGSQRMVDGVSDMQFSMPPPTPQQSGTLPTLTSLPNSILSYTESSSICMSASRPHSGGASQRQSDGNVMDSQNNDVTEWARECRPSPSAGSPQAPDLLSSNGLAARASLASASPTVAATPLSLTAWHGVHATNDVSSCSPHELDLLCGSLLSDFSHPDDGSIEKQDHRGNSQAGALHNTGSLAPWEMDLACGTEADVMPSSNSERAPGHTPSNVLHRHNVTSSMPISSVAGVHSIEKRGSAGGVRPSPFLLPMGPCVEYGTLAEGANLEAPDHVNFPPCTTGYTPLTPTMLAATAGSSPLLHPLYAMNGSSLGELGNVHKDRSHRLRTLQCLTLGRNTLARSSHNAQGVLSFVPERTGSTQPFRLRTSSLHQQSPGRPVLDHNGRASRAGSYRVSAADNDSSLGSPVSAMQQVFGSSGSSQHCHVAKLCHVIRHRTPPALQSEVAGG